MPEKTEVQADAKKETENQNLWRAEIDRLRAEQRKIIDMVDQAKAQIRLMNDAITAAKEKMKAGVPYAK